MKKPFPFPSYFRSSFTPHQLFRLSPSPVSFYWLSKGQVVHLKKNFEDHGGISSTDIWYPFTGLGRVVEKTFPKHYVSLWVNKFTTDTDETAMLKSWLINVVSGLASILDFINDRPRSVFFKRLRTGSGVEIDKDTDHCGSRFQDIL